MKRLAVLVVLAFAGCSTFQKGQELAQSTGVDQKALQAIEAYAASKGLPISLTGAQAPADPFANIPATYSEWVDAKGAPIAFPITRVVTKEFKETVGATTVSTLQVPAPAAVVQIPTSTSGQTGLAGTEGISAAELAAIKLLEAAANK